MIGCKIWDWDIRLVEELDVSPFLATSALNNKFYYIRFLI